MATHHTLSPERAHLHGHFSRDLTPILTIDPGDTVSFQTLEATWALEPHPLGAAPRKMVEGRDPEKDKGHALIGPVYVRGAKPGMALAVQIDAITVGPFGTTFAGGWSCPWNERLGVTREGVTLAWQLDAEKGIGRNQHGHEVTLSPFMGVMGVAPAEPGVHITAPPRRVGGNIDCKRLVAGTTLYLPIEVEGALFSVGDGHGAQGDGEVSVTAIECPMDEVKLTFRLEQMALNAPLAHTPAGWVTFGFHEDLNEAAAFAVQEMVALIQRQHRVSSLDALALASVVADFHVTQVVNGVKGVHGVLPPGAIR